MRYLIRNKCIFIPECQLTIKPQTISRTNLNSSKTERLNFLIKNTLEDPISILKVFKDKDFGGGASGSGGGADLTRIAESAQCYNTD